MFNVLVVEDDPRWSDFVAGALEDLSVGSLMVEVAFEGIHGLEICETPLC